MLDHAPRFCKSKRWRTCKPLNINKTSWMTYFKKLYSKDVGIIKLIDLILVRDVIVSSELVITVLSLSAPGKTSDWFFWANTVFWDWLITLTIIYFIKILSIPVTLAICSETIAALTFQKLKVNQSMHWLFKLIDQCPSRTQPASQA